MTDKTFAFRFACAMVDPPALIDRNQPISAECRLNAQGFKTAWRHQGFTPMRVFASTAARVTQAGLIATWYQPVALEELFLGTDLERAKELAMTLRQQPNAALAAYLKSPAIKGHLQEYAKAAKAAIATRVRDLPNGSNIAVFGHAVLLHVVAAELIRWDTAHPAYRKIMEAPFQGSGVIEANVSLRIAA